MSKLVELLSLGAGVQSSTAALKAVHGEILPMPECGIFADTKDEKRSTYDWLSWLCGVEVKTDELGRAYVDPGTYQSGKLTFPVRIVTSGRLSDSALLMRRTKDGRLYSTTNIPFFTRNHDGSEGKIKHRGCTKDFKLKPILSEARKIVGRDVMLSWRATHKVALKELAKWHHVCRELRRAAKDTGRKPLLPLRPQATWQECQDDPLVIQWIGISLDEISRMKESRDAWVKCRWPLIEQRTSRGDCLTWMNRHGYPEPPGSACKYCPFHDDDEWRRMKANEPEEFNQAGIFEKRLQEIKASSQNFRTTPYLHRSLVPLGQVDLSTEEDQGQLNMFNNECEGMCGV